MKEVSAMKLRMRFGKEGIVKFIGHLDIMQLLPEGIQKGQCRYHLFSGLPSPSMSVLCVTVGGRT